ncbi:TPA: EF-P lysine aminoacylase GenX [Candidatus Uhrbacteria bacterium]|uniref:tRNA synthetase class II (D K and N) n=1 Tax=Candidatus Uhrbacteria bacterium GW2011_GWC2_53_7 TaxID=1618986 RepID=A0A0G1XZY1_9BACT|nr:MAG: tRNA synthetase class II (D K and N) [Candidatus Uhrbacteria bacterium GW2011_GWC2_53_7]OGL71180.1 MAG: hypothetical protein A3D69_02580 [Candidatus Uhrbacteria bacterium RIFCSPHIGHO2_02_FULL_54_11]HBL39804.1 EF-P lysine aminoacylase GenX [Candidatus Uhrbacteria bacterium]
MKSAETISTVQLRSPQIAKIRMDALSAIRFFFVSRDFVEVETPLLVASPDMDPALSPLEVRLKAGGKAALITSPEYSLKKLLGSGMKKIFSLNKVFRDEEAWDERHVSEFTMVEWYEAGADYRSGMRQTRELILAVATALNVVEHPLLKEWEVKRMEELFAENLGVEQVGLRTREELLARARRLDIHTHESDSWSDVFYRLYLAKIEPTLPTDRATVICDYPLPQAALSRPCPDGVYAERFELFSGTLELCNAFTELTDADEQRRRFECERAERERLGKTVFPIDEELLRLLPSVQNPTFGNALGVDRLLMTLLGAKSLDEILLFPPVRLFGPPSTS